MICVAKTKVTVQLICPFVFAYAKIRFSHDMADIAMNINDSNWDESQ